MRWCCVNYRGSTGYGSAWRDANEDDVGHTELADVAAVREALVADGTLDPARTAVTGGSWGGYLALLAAGIQPDLWAAVIAIVPVADYVAEYEDEMEPLRAFDRALLGGSPEEVPEQVRAGVTAHLCGRGEGSAAGDGRAERPALPDPADRELPAPPRRTRHRIRALHATKRGTARSSRRSGSTR